jgi:hypothetical protein
MGLALASWLSAGPTRAARADDNAKSTGRTFYVNPNGDDTADGRSTVTAFRTLQRAADATAPGDTVNVMGGTYTNEKHSYALVVLSTPGRPDAWITYQAYPGDKPLLQGDDHSWDVVRFTNKAAYITLRGFTVIGNDAHVTLAQAQANATTPAQHPETNGSCISVNGHDGGGNPHPHHIRILQNTAAQCPGGGIVTLSADYVTIAGNTVYDDSWYSAFGTSGISLLGSVDTDPTDTKTKYKMVVEGNVVYGNQEFIPWVDYKPPTITDGEGIIVDSNKNSAYPGGNDKNPPYAGRTLVANNVVYRNGSAAIEVFQSAHVDVVNNSTYGNVITPVETGRGELNLNVVSDVTVLNNIFVSAPGESPLVMNSVCTDGCRLDYNVYFGGKNSLKGMAEGSHDLVADPMYVASDAGSANLRLRSGSPALGSGTLVLAPKEDVDGKARPAAAVSRGAYR